MNANSNVITISDELEGCNVQTLRQMLRKAKLVPSHVASVTGRADAIAYLKGEKTYDPSHEGGSFDRAALLAQALDGLIASPLDESRVREMIEEALAGFEGGKSSKVELTVNGSPLGSVEGAHHCQLFQVTTWIRSGVPVWLWGGAGAGKTHMARQIADLLKVPCYVQSIDPTTTVGKLLGYRNLATGEFVEGSLYQPYKNGGLWMADEIDSGDAGILASLNALFANGQYLFPNGETVTRHPDFYVLAGANTKGTGAVGWYKARVPLDGATLDRFAVVELTYDEGLELELATAGAVKSQSTVWHPGQPASEETIAKWVYWVQAVRRAAGNAVLISPRASLNGAKALRVGIPAEEVVNALVFKLTSSDARTRLESAAGKFNA